MQEESDQSANELSSEQKSRLKVTLLTSPEGRLLLAGVAMAFIYTFWLGIKLLLSPEDSQILIGMSATQVLFGRAAGLAFGYSLGLGHITVISICIILETIMVLILYPLFVFSWRHLLVIKGLKKIFENTNKAAINHKDKIQKYGILSLFIFVWFPFWMTGPVVGCVIGFFLGLRVWVNMTVVFFGTVAAVLGWAFFLSQFHERVASYSSYATMVLVALLILIVILGHYMHRAYHKNKS